MISRTSPPSSPAEPSACSSPRSVSLRRIGTSGEDGHRRRTSGSGDPRSGNDTPAQPLDSVRRHDRRRRPPRPRLGPNPDDAGSSTPPTSLTIPAAAWTLTDGRDGSPGNDPRVHHQQSADLAARHRLVRPQRRANPHTAHVHVRDPGSRWETTRPRGSRFLPAAFAPTITGTGHSDPDGGRRHESPSPRRRDMAAGVVRNANSRTGVPGTGARRHSGTCGCSPTCRDQVGTPGVPCGRPPEL